MNKLKNFRRPLLVSLSFILFFLSSSCIKTTGSLNEEILSTLSENIGFRVKRYSVYVSREFTIPAEDLIGVQPFTFAIDQGIGTIGEKSGTFIAPSVLGFAIVSVTDSEGRKGYVSVDVVDDLKVKSTEFSMVAGSSYLLQVSGGKFPYTFVVESGDVKVDENGYVAAGVGEGLAQIKVIDFVGNSVLVGVNVIKNIRIVPDQFSISTVGYKDLSVLGGVGSPQFRIASGMGTVTSNPARYSAGGVPGTVVVAATDELSNLAYSYGRVFGLLQISPSIIMLAKNTTYNQFEALGGVAPFTFTTSGTGSINSTSGQFNAPSTTGTTSVTVTDALGYISEAKVIITENTRFVVKNAIVQIGDTLDFNNLIEGGSSPYLFTVNEGSFSNLIFHPPASPGAYIITVRDSNNLQVQTSVLVYPSFKIVPEQMTIAVNSLDFFSVNGGLPPYTFSIASGVGTINPQTGAYLAGVTVGSAVIEVRDSGDHVVKANVNIKDRLSIIADTQSIQGGGVVHFSASGGLGPYIFDIASGVGELRIPDISQSEKSELVTSLSQGIVQVEVRDAIGNRDSSYIQVLGKLSTIPPSLNIKVNQQYFFSGQGGLGPYEFTLVAGTGGSIKTDGLYKAGPTPGTDMIRLKDKLGNIYDANIMIYENLQIFPKSKSILIGQQLQMSVLGGVAPFTFSLSSGLGAISSDGLFTATNTPGNVVIHVVDKEGDYADALIVVNPTLEIVPTGISLKTNKPYNFAAAGGIAPYKFSVVSANGGSINTATGEYIAPNSAGNYQVQVKDSAGNLANATVSVSSSGNGGNPSVGPGHHIIYLAGNNQSGSVMTVLPISLQVKVVDTAGIPVPNYNLKVIVTSGSGNPGYGNISTGIDGVASTPYFLGSSAGSEKVRIESAGTALPGSPSYLDFDIVALPGQPSLAQSTILASPAVNIPADGNSTSSITVTIRDLYKNPIPNIGVTLTTSGTGNTLAQSSANTNSLGQLTATLRSTFAEAKLVSIAVPEQLMGLNTAIGFGYTIIPDASKSSITALNNNIVADGVSQGTILINLKSASNEAAAGYIPLFTATDSNSGNTYATCSAADFSGNSICTMTSTKAESKILSITAPLIKAGASITFIHGTPAKIFFAQQPVTTATNISFNPQPIVELQDVFGNQVTTALESNGTVNITMNSGTGILSGTTSMTATQGRADFISKNLAFNRAGSKTLKATWGTFSTNSNPFSIYSTPVQLQWQGSTSISRGNCSAFSLSAMDTNGDLTIVTSNLNINLGGAGAGSFYSDSSCTIAIVSTNIATDSATRNIYYRNNLASALNFTADASGFPQSSYGVNVVVGAPTRLVWSGPILVNSGVCSSALTISTQDNSNQNANVNSNLLVTLGGKGGGSFYSDPACSLNVDQISIVSGTSASNLYYKSNVAENLVFTASATGLTQGIFNFESTYGMLYLTGATNGISTFNGSPITSCGGGSVCDVTKPFNPNNFTTQANPTPASLSQFKSIAMENGAYLSTGAWVYPSAAAPGVGMLDITTTGDFNLCLNCVITVSGKGYTVGYGNAKGASAGNDSAGGGGGHAGPGGNSNYNIAGGTMSYGSIFSPLDLGSAGGTAGGEGGVGGSGGGIVKLTVNGNFNFNGKIYANGANGSPGSYDAGGGGAGGAIKVVAGTISGAGGVLHALGGSGGSSGGRVGGGGGGGRIAFYYKTDLYSGGSGLIDAKAYGAYGGYYGGPGTVYFKNNSTLEDSLTFDQNNGGLTKYTINENLTITNLTIRQNAAVEVGAGVTLTVNGSSSYYGGYMYNRGTLANPVVNLNWTLYNFGNVTYPQSDLVVKAGGHLIDYVNNSFRNVTIESGGIITSALMPTTYNILEVKNGGLLDHLSNTSTKMYWLDITAVNLNLAGDVNVSYMGYANDMGTSKGNSAGNDYCGGGGAHGGVGGNCNYGPTGGTIIYDSYSSPSEFGSGGGTAGAEGGIGGSGGGFANIVVSGTFNFTGKVQANGENGAPGSYDSGGGGAGGSIKIVTNKLSGSGGIVRAFGGNGGVSGGRNAGGGGGGRIALYFNTDLYLGGYSNISLLAHGGGGGSYGGPGSIYIKNNTSAEDTLIFDQNNGNAATTVITGNVSVSNLTVKQNAALEIANGSTLNVSGGLNYASGIMYNRGTLSNPVVNLNWVLYNYGTLTYPQNDLVVKSGGHLIDYVNNSFHNVTIENGGKITLALMPTTYNILDVKAGGILTHIANSSTKNYWIDVSTAQLNLSGEINVQGCGFAQDQGPAKGTPTGNDLPGGGGGYGGRGGNGNYGAAGGSTTYGVYSSPSDIGSGGGTGGNEGGVGGAGGGLVKLNISDTFTFNGRINANGANGAPGSYDAGGGGAGGGIKIITNVLAGAGGIIEAFGGAGGSSGGRVGGGGGGGRIALLYASDTYNTNVTDINTSAQGGSGGTYGAAGSIYFKNLTNSEDSLVFDQKNGGVTNHILSGNVTVTNLTVKSNAAIEIPSGATLNVTGTYNYYGGYITNFGTLQNPIVNLNWTIYNFGTVTYPLSDLSIKFGGHLIEYVNSTFNNVTVEYGGKLTMALMPTTYNTFEVRSGGHVTHLANSSTKNYWIDIAANNLILSGTLMASGLGYPADLGPAKGSPAGNDSAAGGGGHGGAGGTSNYSIVGGGTYGSVSNPQDIGSGGGTGGAEGGIGGAGGGYVNLVVSGTLLLSGKIYANGSNGSPGSYDAGGGGAGGSIKINVNVLNGSGGVLQAFGGDGGSSGGRIGGGGGGGRIAVYYTTDAYTGGVVSLNTSVVAGSGGTGAGNGSLIVSP
jgi:hypothetical protein